MTCVATALRAPRRLLLTLRLGEMPEDMPSLLACRRHRVPMARRIDGGPLDRILRHYGDSARAARLHTSLTRPSQRPSTHGARRYDDVEQITGVARVLRIEVGDDRGVPALIDALAQVSTVESVRPDLICSVPFDTEAAALDPPTRVDHDAAWRSRELIHLPQALGYEPGDAAVVIGLADTGVSAQHAELKARVRRGFDTVDLDSATVGDLTLIGDNSRRDEWPDDEVGHGSGCAGILTAAGTDLPPGGAGECSLVPVRVLGAALAGRKRMGIGALANIDAGMKRLIDLGVRVINMSFGTAESVLAPSDPRPHAEVIRYALARGVLLTAASGNSGIAERLYPAALDGVIAVGSIGNDLTPSKFSTRGDHVALCAPGSEVWTCGRTYFQRASGTSFAAPFVAAVCALLVAHASRRAWPLTPAIARDVLLRSARPFGIPNVEGCGHGVVDALGALQLLDELIDAALDEDGAA